MSSHPLEDAAITEVEGPAYAAGVPVRITGKIRPFSPGSVVAQKYLVERELAEGGLGIVVVATHLELGRRVAIKYLKPSVLENPDLVERFKREAQLAVSIRSDHVVRVYDVGSDPLGGPYMVMELLDGEDLGARLERGALSVHEAIDYVVQACDALAAAHALGIVHRDLKPENLFLANRDGAAPIVKILDFGISKVSDKRKNAAPQPRLRQVTENGLRLGTPVYMSPEQLIATSQVDARSDIWSLGVVLYELLTRALPFEGDSVPALGANIVAAPPTPLRARLPAASPALEACILRCLEKKPDDRYRNVAELVQELAGFEAPASMPRIERIKHVVTEGGESIRPPRPLGMATPMDAFTPVVIVPPALPARSPPRRRWPLFAGAAVIGALAIGGSFVATRREPPAPPPPVVARVPDRLAEPAPTVRETPSAAPVTAAPAVAVSSAPRASAPPPAKPKPPRVDYAEFGERQ